MPTSGLPGGTALCVSSHLERLAPRPGVQGSGRTCWLGLQVRLRQPRELLQSPPTQAGPCHLPAWHLRYRKKWHGPRKRWCVDECTRAGLLGDDGQLEGRVSASQGAICYPFHCTSVPCW